MNEHPPYFLQETSFIFHSRDQYIPTAKALDTILDSLAVRVQNSLMGIVTLRKSEHIIWDKVVRFFMYSTSILSFFRVGKPGENYVTLRKRRFQS